MENLGALKAFVLEKKNEVISSFNDFTKQNSRPVYWVAAGLMAVSGAADAVLLSSTIFSKSFLLFSAFLGLGLFLYKTVEKKGNDSGDFQSNVDSHKEDTISVITGG